MRTHHPRPIIGTNKAILFNERFAPGSLVAVRRTPGEPASWDRVFAPAYAAAGDSAMVELASSLVPVDTDLVFACPPEIVSTAPVDAAIDPVVTPFSRLVLAFVAGAPAAVLLALSVQPAPAAVSAVGADCDMPAVSEEQTA